MICGDRVKLIYYPVGNVFQLFDLEENPLEQRNLAIQEDYAGIQVGLTKLLIQHLYGEGRRAGGISRTSL